MTVKELGHDEDAALRLVLDFTNTHAGGRSERFDDAAGLRGWLTEVGSPDEAATDADAATGRELRDALQTLLRAHAGDDDNGSLDVEDVEKYLERVSARYPMFCVVSADGVTWDNALIGADRAYASVLTAVTEIAQRGLWGRVKACRNDICREAFVDRSRNGSARYHSSNCASMVSMRALRQRRRESDN